MSITCNNCGSEVNVTARICPYCHCSPYIVGGQPYPSAGESDLAFTACVWGTLMLPVLPIASGVLLGIGVLGKILSWRKA